MITRDLKSKIDLIWDTMWSGGISNAFGDRTTDLPAVYQKAWWAAYPWREKSGGDGVLFDSSTAHKALRKTLVEDQKLDAIVSMPSGVFKPYAGVSTAILFFTKTNWVWFYDMQSDGFSLEDKRTP